MYKKSYPLTRKKAGVVPSRCTSTVQVGSALINTSVAVATPSYHVVRPISSIHRPVHPTFGVNLIPYNGPPVALHPENKDAPEISDPNVST